MPFFSIVIPMYNRERFIARALQSCLSQEFGDFEVVVVDDGSTDASREVVRQIRDPRIRLLCHAANRGRCPSRNTGLSAAGGEWVVFLDSDDELLPGALGRIRERALEVSGDVGALRFMCEDDAGQRSPNPPHRDELLDYEGYIRWMEATAHGREEALPSARRSTFPGVRYSEGHAEEAMYHLDMARSWRVRTCPDIVRLYHADADNRVMRPTPEQVLRYAGDSARDVEQVLARHGPALRAGAPTVYAGLLQNGMLLNFLAGHRRRALVYAVRRLLVRPVLFRTCVILVVGLLGPTPLAWLKTAWAGRLGFLGLGKRRTPGSIQARRAS